MDDHGGIICPAILKVLAEASFFYSINQGFKGRYPYCVEYLTTIVATEILITETLINKVISYEYRLTRAIGAIKQPDVRPFLKVGKEYIVNG